MRETLKQEFWVMTHDLMTFYDAHKILEEIIEKCKQQWNMGQIKFNRFELRDEEIIPFQYKSRHEYSELIQTIYKFGLGQAGDQSIVIGNIMRQVLEHLQPLSLKKESIRFQLTMIFFLFLAAKSLRYILKILCTA